MNFLRRISSYFNVSERPTAAAAKSARHILDFSEEKCQLQTENEQLVVLRENSEPQKIPFCDIAVVIIANPMVTVSQSVMEKLGEYGAMFTVCNYKYRPASMMLPFEHSSVVERLQLQIEATQPMIKQAWQQIVQRKIEMQRNVLLQFGSNDAGLTDMIKRVKSGDPDNLEAQAAKKYWAALFPNIDFHRNPDSDDAINNRLNYGYTVLRSITARAVCALGLHPALGIHHCTARNAFCLADDLMEPFRPIVDTVVKLQYQVSRKSKSQPFTKNLTGQVKQQLVGTLTRKYIADGERRKLFNIITLLAESLLHFYEKKTDRLYLPVLELSENDE
jgi:CRISPR-associated protein Cas1